MTTEDKLKDALKAEARANERANSLEDEMAAWVRKLNRIAFEIDQIWDGTHPSVAEQLDDELTEKFKALAASIRDVPNAEITGGEAVRVD